MTEHHCVFTELTLAGVSNCECGDKRKRFCVDCWEQDKKCVAVLWCEVDKKGCTRALCSEHREDRYKEFEPEAYVGDQWRDFKQQ